MRSCMTEIGFIQALPMGALGDNRTSMARSLPTDSDVLAYLARLAQAHPTRAEDVRTLARVRGLCDRALAGDERARRVVGWLIEAVGKVG